MELSSTVMLLLVLLLSVVHYVRMKMQSNNLPPGPFRLPVIGNLHIMMGKYPHKALKAVADRHGPLMLIWMGNKPTMVVSNSEWAKLVCKNHDSAFSSRPRLMVGECIFYNNHDFVFCEYGEEWKLKRKICTMEVLSSSKMDSLRGMREEEIGHLIKKLLQQGSSSLVDLSEAIYSFQFNALWRSIARKGFSNKWEELSHLMHEITEFILKGSLWDVNPLLGCLEFGVARRRMTKAFNKFDAFADKVLKDHIALGKPSDNQTQSFVDVLQAVSQEDTRITNRDIKALILDLFVAGSESIGATVEWAISLLLRHPEYLDELHSEIDENVGEDGIVRESELRKMKMLRCVVKEVLRLYPAGPLGLVRESTETVNMKGYVIPKGTRILTNLWAIGRDPDIWEDPHRFNPHRFINEDVIDFSGWTDFKSIPFGAGRRSCPGMNMAIPTIMLVLASLLHAFDISNEGEVDMSENVRIVVTRETHLSVYLKPRAHIAELYCH